MDGRGLKSGKMILSFVQPFCYIPLLESRCRSVQHLCQKLTPPWASLVFPKEKEVTRTATFAAQIAACHRGKEVSVIANKCKHDLFLILFDCVFLQVVLHTVPPSFCLLTQTPSVSASSSAADESCTCCAHSEQAQDLFPPSLLFTLPFSLDGSLYL
ncbi:hypothetical protein AMECASPLE_034572 [Ameca splendens]|uniref:Uncharacterized protein n=1 Tax=Ameca splendens TaxID=208324 RepID=A0ABV1AEN7_9TELE